MAAAENAPNYLWPVNVVDPYGWTYGGLVGEIGRLLSWEWEPVFVRWEEAGHPFKIRLHISAPMRAFATSCGSQSLILGRRSRRP